MRWRPLWTQPHTDSQPPLDGDTQLTFDRLRHVFPTEHRCGHCGWSRGCWSGSKGRGLGQGWGKGRGRGQDGSGLLGQEVEDVLLQDPPVPAGANHLTQLDLKETLVILGALGTQQTLGALVILGTLVKLGALRTLTGKTNWEL